MRSMYWGTGTGSLSIQGAMAWNLVICERESKSAKVFSLPGT